MDDLEKLELKIIETLILRGENPRLRDAWEEFYFPRAQQCASSSRKYGAFNELLSAYNESRSN